MIKFFRHIRQSLIMKNRTGKYFKYAIGEIVLVVIGILIALQINNWNENRKNQVIEIKVLKELLVDLEASFLDLENDISVIKFRIEISENIKTHIHLKKPATDSVLINLFIVSNTTQFSPRISGYENLKSVGLNAITNDTLRKQITDIYEKWFSISVMEGREYDKYDNPTKDLTPLLGKYIIVDMNNSTEINYRESSYKLKTNATKFKNYEQFLEDDFLFSKIQKTIYDRASKISLYELTKSRTKRLIAAINKEIKKLEG